MSVDLSVVVLFASDSHYNTFESCCCFVHRVVVVVVVVEVVDVNECVRAWNSHMKGI